ncbi:ABC transporter substrate-binding protein [Pseudenhygromyxa sp. WMMC2535]|nr:ABC transporter substrate-binding protein [Pseudenhygromyxa sp. WMMC2535]
MTCPHDGAVLIERPGPDPLIGSVIAESFRIDAPLGSGGMGKVYRGVQLSLQRPVAIKILHAERNQPKAIRRFLQETRLSSKLDHPNVVRIIDGGNTREGRCYLVMELLEGRTLEQYVAEEHGGRGLPFDEAREIFEQLCTGVEAAHLAGLVHRDLKPRNVMLVEGTTGSGGTSSTRNLPRGSVVKILDFGLAKELDTETTGLTAEGEFLGTPGYMAPEQASGEGMDERTDVYALAAILYFMLCGQRPFTGRGAAVITAQLSGTFSPLEPGSHDGPAAVAAVIERALQPDPEARHPTVASLRAAVDALVERDDFPSEATTPAGHLLDSSPAEITQDIAASPRPRSPSAAERHCASPKPARGRLSRRAILGAVGLGAVGLGAAGVWAVPTILRPRRPIRLGMSGALTGQAAAIGRGLEHGLRARFELANAREELAWPIELEVLDDGYEPERALANVEALSRRALALVCNVGTATTAASLPALLDARVPLIGAHSGAEHLRREPPDRYVFNYRAGYARETAAIIEHFSIHDHLTPERVAVLAQDDGFGDSGVEGVRRALIAQGFSDFDPVLVCRYPANTANVREAVEAVSARDDLAVALLLAAYRPAAQFVAGVRQAKGSRSPRFATFSPTGGEVFSDEIRSLGHDPAGIVITQVVPHPGSSANGVLRCREALAAAGRPPPDFVSLEGFIVADMVVEALRRVDAPEREALIDALEGFHELDLGFGAGLSFSASDHQGCERVWGTQLDTRGRLDELRLG